MLWGAWGASREAVEQLMDPEDRCVWIFRTPDEGRMIYETGTLNGEDVLPGFSCRVADLFA